MNEDGITLDETKSNKAVRCGDMTPFGTLINDVPEVSIVSLS